MLGRSSSKNVKRSAAVDATPVEGNLISVKKPKAISLVGLPANQTGFKVVRSDNEGESKMSTMIRRTKRSEASPMLRLTFPAGSTQETVNSALETYGLKGYTIEENEGVITATRSDVKSISKESTFDVKLDEAGLMATCARSAAPVTNPGDKPNIAVARFEFDSAKFTLEDVQRWVTEKCVDGEVQEPQNPDQCYVVRRSDVPENEETRQMALEDGVTAVIVRSDDPNVPDGFVAVISEAAYGGWGWGQLDFTAAMADVEFSRAMDDGIWRLRQLLENILLYSPLPLDVRKELSNRALAQFGEYVGTLMDSLPRQLLVSVVRSATVSKENAMTQQAGGSANTTGAATTPPAKTEVTDDKPITRSEFKQLFAEALAESTAQRSATPAVDPAADPAAAPAAEGKTDDPPATLTRADLTAALSDAFKPFAERLEKVEGSTVVRSAPEQNPAPTDDGKSGNVFRGALFKRNKAAA